ncbi:hypothetical protein DPMN_081894 [Dreissena polymorpha]|uniref:Uncharacterized protein n=1 Tax=Dreissena polymorpha TaxID=45954 RepID=A0A9D3Y9H3_DREPO|nr:hypothetical protein DPMN_081894 [Dreissena polymorpha]
MMLAILEVRYPYEAWVSAYTAVSAKDAVIKGLAGAFMQASTSQITDLMWKP